MDINPPADSLPLRVLVPENGLEPTIIYDESAALVMAVIDREGVKGLEDTWDVPGIYVLLHVLDGDGFFEAYVGKAPNGLKTRVSQHVTGKNSKEFWSQALLVCRDTTHGFNSTQTGWLEGRIYQLLKESVNAQVSNQQTPTDNTLAPYEKTMLENCVVPISRVLRLLGFDPATADGNQILSPSPQAKAKTAKYYGIDLKVLMQAGMLQVGERLISLVSAWPGEGEIVVPIGIRLRSNGITYDTPSAAGAAIKGGLATNGWSFWGVKRDDSWIPLSTIREQYLEKQMASKSLLDQSQPRQQ
ncbi:hypothetical protein [Acidithrix sp. C25]|uniref:restriction system modified-DNA reader domain-containing protein n=1 Tax=Acidithrix sp. C25 TaxID=1671482 RepID=UPI00191BB1BC|nr:hypothetical protein [Acidithrix sp. C25]